MKLFSIKEMERLSAIKAHTIRIWEVRYKLFTPLRTNANVRRYSLQDVQRLLNIALLLQKGSKISKAAGFSQAEIDHALHRLTSDGKQSCAVHNLVYYMYCDIEKFDDTLDSCVLFWGIDKTIEQIILPFMKKVELFYYNKKDYETHFVVTALRKKLIVGIETERNTEASKGVALLFLAAGEHYDLFLLYMAYRLKQKGLRVLYLGTNISVDNLKDILEAKQPDLLYTFIPQKQKFKLFDFAQYAHQRLPNLTFYVVTCEMMQQKENVNNLNFLHYQSFDSLINDL